MPVFQLTDKIVFPPPELAEPNGLLAVGGDLSSIRLIAAYAQGIFPWYTEGEPLVWWFTHPRMVLFPEEIRISRRLARYHRNTQTVCTINRAFAEVINCCAETGKDHREETWITKDMITAYNELNRLGYAHSVECWEMDKLVGGLYGIAIGNVFFGESMFSKISNSSKFALMHLVDFLNNHHYRLIDCQMSTNHLASFGAKEISGRHFQMLLKEHITTLKPRKIWHH